MALQSVAGYHFAHGVPFNRLSMVLFLMAPGLVTSLVYFLGHDVYAAEAIQNVLATFGVMTAVDLGSYEQPLYALDALALVAVLALIGAHVLLGRWAQERRRKEIR